MQSKFVLTFIVVSIILIGIFVWRKEGAVKVFQSEKISFKYPAEYEPRSKLAATKHAQQLGRWAIQQPLSIIELNKETGAIIAANITKSPFLDTLEKNASRSLPLNYSGYQAGKTERLKLSGRDASHINFLYVGKDKKTKLYMHFYILPLGNDAYYLFVQSVDQKRADNDAKRIQPTIQIR